MRKMLLAALIFSCTLLCVGESSAKVVQLSDERLNEVSGQGGISISASHLDFDINAETIYYKDSDGIGAGTTAGFYSLCGVKLKGTADFATPLTVSVSTVKDDAGKTTVTQTAIRLGDMTLHIEKFSIEDRRLGNAAGSGGSLGSFGINNLTVKVSGAISLYAN